MENNKISPCKSVYFVGRLFLFDDWVRFGFDQAKRNHDARIRLHGFLIEMNLNKVHYMG